MDLLTGGWNDYGSDAASDPKERLNISNENKVICTFVVPKKCENVTKSHEYYT